MSEEVPIHLKICLTVDEAAKLTNIGRDRLLELAKVNGGALAIQVGRKILFKRVKLEEHLLKSSVI